MPSISIIIPLFNEAENIPLTFSELEQLPFSFEYIFIDDGSTDGSWNILQRLSKKHSSVKALRFSRNFGKEHALFAGIEHCTTSAAIIMDADLQHPPEYIPEMIAKWQSTNCDIVHAQKSNRRNESSGASPLVSLFYLMYEKWTAIPLKGASDFKLINRTTMDAYVQLEEKELFFRGLIPWLGFKQETITFTVKKRRLGHTKWNPLSRTITALNAISSFSALPLQIITFIGTLFSLGSAGFIFYTLYQWWLGNAPAGFTTIIILILVIGSTLMMGLGVIGFYLSHIYTEIKGRPKYIISNKIGLE